jgi:hypothetical protein
MKKELDVKLVKDFPNLYADRNASIMNSCMGFGFECDDGWYQIIYDLSEKLEKEIVQFGKQHPEVYKRCYRCSCKRENHQYQGNRCLSIHKIQTKWYVNNYSKKFRLRFPLKLQQFVNKVLGLFFYELRSCHCDRFDPSLPRASQVKEKYGTLRFYMSGGTDKIYEFIDEAERKSAQTCEVCGAHGDLRVGGWLKTLCDEHATEEDGTIRRKYKDIKDEEQF